MSSTRKKIRVIKYSSIDTGFHIAAVSLIAWGCYEWLTIVDSNWLRIVLGIFVGLPLSVTIRPIIVPIVYLQIAIGRAIMAIIRKELKL